MLKLEFSFRSDGKFLVTTRFGSPELVNSSALVETTYESENTFLELVIAADLDDETTKNLVVAVLRSVAKAEEAVRWIPALLTEEQIAICRLNLPARARSASALRHKAITELPLGLMDNASHFYDFLMNAPTPFVMLSGPEHIFTFVNPACVQLLGRTSSDQLLGLPVREALPDPGFEVCLSVLHKAYETGEPQSRKELLNSFRQEDTGLLVDAYFDIVYHPVRDAAGSVVGIMAQATDVTERVLSRQVSESREQKLYRLWAELETIYAAVPVGIAVIDANDFRLLRLNGPQASFFASYPEALSGKSLNEVAGIETGFLNLLKRAARGEKLLDVLLEQSAVATKGPWSVSIHPSLDPSGQIETLTLITMDLGLHGELPQRHQLVAT